MSNDNGESVRVNSYLVQILMSLFKGSGASGFWVEYHFMRFSQGHLSGGDYLKGALCSFLVNKQNLGLHSKFKFSLFVTYNHTGYNHSELYVH